MLCGDKMNVFANITRYPTTIVLLLATMSAISGCGLMPAGQMSTRSFKVTGFSLPVNMVYTGKPEVVARVSGIASSEAVARGFVERLVMQTVFDVLERQARSALMPDPIISTILGQLNVTVTYTPMMCQDVLLGLGDNTQLEMMETRCIIVGNTVTGTCTNPGVKAACNTAMNVMGITGSPLTISGTLRTTNIIMANWSRMMWQGVVNRAIRALASRPFGSHFFSATATVDGN